jgi:hypothetical protein
MTYVAVPHGREAEQNHQAKVKADSQFNLVDLSRGLMHESINNNPVYKPSSGSQLANLAAVDGASDPLPSQGLVIGNGNGLLDLAVGGGAAKAASVSVIGARIPQERHDVDETWLSQTNVHVSKKVFISRLKVISEIKLVSLLLHFPTILQSITSKITNPSHFWTSEPWAK